jgi:hypothetical protein
MLKVMELNPIVVKKPVEEPVRGDASMRLWKCTNEMT